MNKSIEEIEREIVEACEKAKAEGWTIISESFGDHTRKLCCPIAATSLDVLSGAKMEAFGYSLGLSPDEVQDFYRGFDQDNLFEGANKELYALGQKLRGVLL